MLRDASQKQVIQKFSFIESLNIPRKEKTTDRKVAKSIESGLGKNSQQPIDREEIDVKPAFDFIPQVRVKPNPQTTEELTSAIVAAGVRDTGLTVGELVGYSATDRFLKDRTPDSPNYLGKIFFALVASYCLFVFWWLFGHQGNKIFVRLMGGRHITISNSDLEFIDRLERSLDTIDRQLQAQKSAADRDNEVVYIPVYTPNSAAPSFPQIPVAPTSHPRASAPIAVNPVRSTTPSQPLKIPAPPPLGEPTPLPNKSTDPGKIATAIAKPKTQYTLIGILELGEGKSAALISVGGQTRRFWLGEEIGSSGWILDSIINRTAKINYQGEVRSIAVGDTF